MQLRRLLPLLLLTLFAVQCRTAAPAPQPLRLIGITRSDDGNRFDVPLEQLRSGTAFVDEHVRGFIATTPSNFEVALRLRHDTPSWVYWEHSNYIDAAGNTHRSLIPMFHETVTPTLLSTDVRRFYIAPTDFATVRWWRGARGVETHFQPFLKDVPADGRVQLQLPMDVDGRRYTYTFTFVPL